MTDLRVPVRTASMMLMGVVESMRDTAGFLREGDSGTFSPLVLAEYLEKCSDYVDGVIRRGVEAGEMK